MVHYAQHEYRQTDELSDDENFLRCWEVENDKATMKEKGVQGKYGAVDFSLFFIQGYQKTEKGVKLNDDQEEDRICE